MKNTFCYVHIPFCTSKCKYCRFASFGNIEFLKINAYVDKLINEIQRSSYCVKNNTLKSIYFGGGTPSILSTKHLKNIIKSINEKYIFDKNIEINIEATPITVTKENIKSRIEIGINRISIGVQSLNRDTLKEIGRGEKGDIIQALDNINDRFLPFTKGVPEVGGGGILNISVDFIIGLPHVKKGEIKKDIEYILDNYDFVNHISVYMLEEYYEQSAVSNEDGLLDSKFQNIVYPNNWMNLGINEDDYLGEYIEIKEYLKTRGFISYEISNFAKLGYECKHNNSYWNHSNVVGYGLGAHSLVNNVRFSNSEEFLGYYIGEKQDYEILNNNDIFIEKIMFGLRTSGLEKYIYEKLEYDKLLQFVNDGLLYLEDDVFKLTDRGVMLLDYILRELI
ncbi:MAG: coproporphyrinogen-III oxidase family protein [Candidatus Gracilibacteria bacterium]|nr:coproporphyrinogen-III oxidase family protein [Candidatus Gracilibacteria bacterium]